MINACKHLPETPLITEETEDPDRFNNIPCSDDTIYFQNDILPLISSYCAYSGCHDANSHQDGVVLDNYQNIMEHGKIEKGDPFDSELYDVIRESDPDKVMPPPPNSPLTTDQIVLIKKWIQQGAKNNGCGFCDTVDIAYSTHVVDVLDKNCNACHITAIAEGGVILDTYAGVKKEVDNGRLSAAINHQVGVKKMPPSGIKISDCDIKKIELWISDGAPNN